MGNRLTDQLSPYLLQHASNPVAWEPWDERALARAKREDKPIFLSIGYSACHWCHVMEHESFENPEIASYLNEHFISIKVDREERPDLDQIYMHAVQAMTGRGGWPMSVFLTPELKPFYGGTYWPPTSRMGMPGFQEVLSAVVEAWNDRRAAVHQQADQLTDHLQQLAGQAMEPGKLGSDVLRSAAVALERSFDHSHGGFGGAPKFPHAIDLRVLMRAWRRTGRDGLLSLVTLSLDKMAAGGIYDQLGGGFHRYAVDARWLVPHFEKMLYDNALLAVAYLEAYLATGREAYRRIVRETLDYVLREMTDAAGGFYSAQDADSEGEEGKFYVWSRDEILRVLGKEQGETFCQVYDVTDSGNFEGKSILNLPRSIDSWAKLLAVDADKLRDDLDRWRAKLLAVRGRRVAPGLDDKVLVAWNGLMIEALARAGAVLGEPRYAEAARRAAAFLHSGLRGERRELLHCWRAGKAHLDAYLDDYACLANAMVTMYETTFDENWIDVAVGLADEMLARFEDRKQGAFFFVGEDHQLIARQKDLQDSSVPSGNAMAAMMLLRLGKLCGRSDYLASAERALESCVQLMQQAPTAAGQLLVAADFLTGPTSEVVLVESETHVDGQQLLDEMRQRFWPNKVVARRPATGHSGRLDPLFAGKEAVQSQPTLYLCENFACQAPISGAEAIRAAWLEHGGPVRSAHSGS